MQGLAAWAAILRAVGGRWLLVPAQLHVLRVRYYILCKCPLNLPKACAERGAEGAARYLERAWRPSKDTDA
jgi:hypothetical protein